MTDESAQLYVSCFDPIADINTKILILGTLPGPKSIETNQYYADSRNSFWKIIYAIWGQATPSLDYGQKCDFLLQHYIGVWDVLGKAKREGFADANIENPVPNNLLNFLMEHPECGIVFNEKKAEGIFQDAFPSLYDTVKHELVLSSSGSLGRTWTDKLDSWKTAIARLANQN